VSVARRVPLGFITARECILTAMESHHIRIIQVRRDQPAAYGPGHMGRQTHPAAGWYHSPSMEVP